MSAYKNPHNNNNSTLQYKTEVHPVLTATLVVKLTSITMFYLELSIGNELIIKRCLLARRNNVKIFPIPFCLMPSSGSVDIHLISALMIKLLLGIAASLIILIIFSERSSVGFLLFVFWFSFLNEQPVVVNLRALFLLPQSK